MICYDQSGEPKSAASVISNRRALGFSRAAAAYHSRYYGSIGHAAPLGTSVSRYSLDPVAIFGYETAPPAAHLHPDIVDLAIKGNTTVNHLWAAMTEATRRNYLPELYDENGDD